MRCGAPNRCPYCAWLTATENVLVVGLDAREGVAPTVGMTLTTHRADFGCDRFRQVLKTLFRGLRAQYGSVEYCAMIEWSTGSGGHGRLMHAHALVKGIDAAITHGGCGAPSSHELRNRRQRCGRCFECQVSVHWERLTDGAWRVEARELRSAGGAVAYMVGHHHKREQAPPARLRGVKRMRPSQGYYADAITVAVCESTGERPLQRRRRQAREIMREGALNAGALAQLASTDAPAALRDDLLDELVAQARDAPAPQLVKLARNGSLVIVASTGEIVDDERSAA